MILRISWKKWAENRINSVWQFRLAPLIASYTARYMVVQAVLANKMDENKVAAIQMGRSLSHQPGATHIGFVYAFFPFPSVTTRAYQAAASGMGENVARSCF